MRELSQRLKH